MATRARPASESQERRPRVFRGWTIVAAGFGVIFVVYGLQFSFGTFVDDIVATTGWSETRLQLIYACYIFAYSALSAVSGLLTDRFGPRRIVAGGAVLLALGYLTWAAAPNIWVAFLGLGVIAPIGMSASWVPCNATVVRWFVERRGTAVAITTAGGSLANIVVPPIAAALVQASGWRVAIVVLASIGGVVMLIAAMTLRRDPESMGLLPDGASSSTADLSSAASAAVTDTNGQTLREATRTSAFWMIFVMYALSFVVVFVPFAHVSQFATGLGISPVTASTAISAIGVGGLAGRLGVGPISDRVGRTPIVATAFLLQALAFTGIALAQGLLLLYPSAAVFGFAYGAAVALFPPLVGDHFGRAHAGAIVGRLFAMAGSMAAVGPYIAQLLVDASGSYRLAFLLAGAANAAAMLMATRLPPPSAD